ncbi:MAG: hypothetical protein JJT96_05550 [Opitutales bacterium]|nr:hypothetical protein [Opitutales bacterium]
MPRKETILTIFVASPSDVTEERKALESIVSELNRTWSKNLNLRLELLKWETDVYPGFGKCPQDVINNQIDDEYDIFISIFWSKIGTPTASSASGTIEEFNRAYAKYKTDSDSVDLMVYFKDQPIPPSRIDPAQLTLLSDVKSQLGELGGLYWTFESIKDFESLLRSHLSKVAQRWSSKPEKSTLTEQTINSIDADSSAENKESLEDNDDYGLFDYIEIYEERMADHGSALNALTDATQRIGTQFTRRSEEINGLELGDGKNADRKQARRILKSSSEDLIRYSDIVNIQIKLAAQAREDSFEALSKALSLYVDFDEDFESLNDLEEGLEQFKDATNGTKKGIIGFRNTVSAFPRLTIQLNKSKRQTLCALDSVLEEIETTAQSCASILKAIREIKKESKS